MKAKTNAMSAIVAFRGNYLSELSKPACGGPPTHHS